MKVLQLLVLNMLLLLLLGCGANNKAETEIKSTIDALYGAHTNIYEMPLNNVIFSEEILIDIKRIRKETEQDIFRIKHSDYPTDKPFLMEGSTFTSLADGYSKYAIREIFIKGEAAEVLVDFEMNATPPLSWSDKVILKKTNGWKIHNIIFLNTDGDDNLIHRLKANKSDESFR